MEIIRQKGSKSQQPENIYVASCVEDGGIFHYKLVDGRFVLKGITKMDRPMYMIVEKQKMYIVLRAPFENNESGVVVYDLAEDGTLINPTEIMSTKGVVACHIAVHKEKIYCANYISGSVIMLPDTVIKHSGKGIHPKRQEGPHVHYVGMTPDEEYLCVTDLGLDTIFLYKTDMTLHSAIKVPDGYGVRHLVFSADGRYLFAVNELMSTVAAYSYDKGELKWIDMCQVVSDAFVEKSTAAAIRIKDDCIYVSNRGEDTIARISFVDNKLSLVDSVKCCGRSPRDFNFYEDYLLCANQDSNSVTVLDTKEDFRICAELTVSMPICVCIN